MNTACISDQRLLEVSMTPGQHPSQGWAGPASNKKRTHCGIMQLKRVAQIYRYISSLIREHAKASLSNMVLIAGGGGNSRSRLVKLTAGFHGFIRAIPALGPAITNPFVRDAFSVITLELVPPTVIHTCKTGVTLLVTPKRD